MYLEQGRKSGRCTLYSRLLYECTQSIVFRLQLNLHGSHLWLILKSPRSTVYVWVALEIAIYLNFMFFEHRVSTGNSRSGPDWSTSIYCVCMALQKVSVRSVLSSPPGCQTGLWTPIYLALISRKWISLYW
jgi:hypothetical protein